MIRAHTYSVVMRDSDSGQLGVGVQSHWFNVGRIVPWVRAGVGAVATQSVAEPMYGPRGLDLMGSGSSAADSMRRLLDDDEDRELRQLGFVDATGGAAAHTGARCIGHASDVVGDGWTVQANIMRSDAVVTAMAQTAEAAEGAISDRILAVLETAERSGGDLRGSQSAAIVVAAAGPVPTLDLRVEDHPEPIDELRRLLRVHRAYEHMQAGDEALGVGDDAGAAAAYEAAATGAGENPEVLFWQAVTMASLGHMEQATAVLGHAVEANPDLEELLRRLPETELVDRAVAETLLGRNR